MDHEKSGIYFSKNAVNSNFVNVHAKSCFRKVFLRCLSHTANGQDHDDDDIESEGGSSYAYSEDSTSEASDTLLDGVDNEGYVVVPFSQTKPSDEVYEQEVVTPREFTFLYK